MFSRLKVPPASLVLAHVPLLELVLLSTLILTPLSRLYGWAGPAQKALIAEPHCRASGPGREFCPCLPSILSIRPDHFSPALGSSGTDMSARRWMEPRRDSGTILSGPNSFR